VHNLILHKVRRESDGQWRALDSMSLYRHRPAASAIAALATENALTHGREIAGVQQALMDMFSSRRRSIGPLTARLAQAFEAQFGRAPDARALTSLRQWANHATRRGKDTAPLDMAALVRQWSAQARASEAGALEPLAPAVMGTGAQAKAAGPDNQTGQAPAPTTALTKAQARRLIDEAVAAVQTAQSTWTEADLIRHLGERLPAHVGAMSAPEAATLVPALARQALASQAVALAAPEWPRVPDCLRRASGESLYIPHGATRYATSAQLTLEERLLAHARETGAPRLRPAAAARFLGAKQARLEARLQAHAPTQDDFSASVQPDGSRWSTRAQTLGRETGCRDRVAPHVPWDRVVWNHLLSALGRDSVVSQQRRHVKVDDVVLVPWRLEEPVHACVVEVWGDPPSQVRVQLLLDEDDERPVLLVPEEIMTQAV
jgi:hypothetical protein